MTTIRSPLTNQAQAQSHRAEAPAAAAAQLRPLIDGLRQAKTIDEIGAALDKIADSIGGESKAEVKKSAVAAAKAAMEKHPEGVRSLMGSLGDDVKLFCGTATPDAVKSAADSLDLDVGRSSLKLFSTGDPFVVLEESVKNRDVLVLQGGPGYSPKEGEPAYDFPTLVAESLQVAFAARSSGAKRVRVVLPEALDPAKHPNDAFASLVAELAKASGVNQVVYHSALDGKSSDAKRSLPLGMPMLEAKVASAEASRALRELASATSLDEVSRSLVFLEVSIKALRGKADGAATALATQVADVLTARVKDLVPEVPDGVVSFKDSQVVVFSGQSNPKLGLDIAQSMSATFGEGSIALEGSTPKLAELSTKVKGKDVVIVQTTRQSPQASKESRLSTMALLTEALMIARAAKQGEAESVTLVLPYMPNARSDKRDQAGVGAYAALVARWVDQLDLGRVVLVEPHDGHVPEMFRSQVSIVSGARVLCDSVIAEMPEEQKKKLVLVRPDEGATKRTKQLAKDLSLPMVNGEKTRAGNDDKAEVQGLGNSSDVAGKVCIVTDDEIATGGTMRQTVARLKAMSAEEVIVAVSHANMPIDASERADAMRKLKEAGADRLVLLDTQPVGTIPPDLAGFVKVVSSAAAIAEAASLS
ncbi:MAG: ribose-phosphate diphosphokinase [Deltaproteobacteria bacterium]|nr:ribose-phosphate diphosphokinase [Deltaproteobacteria bacterium]